MACLYLNKLPYSLWSSHYGQNHTEIPHVNLTTGIHCLSSGVPEVEGTAVLHQTSCQVIGLLHPSSCVAQQNSFPSLLLPPLRFFFPHKRIKTPVRTNLLRNHTKYLVNHRLHDPIPHLQGTAHIRWQGCSCWGLGYQRTQTKGSELGGCQGSASDKDVPREAEPTSSFHFSAGSLEGKQHEYRHLCEGWTLQGGSHHTKGIWGEQSNTIISGSTLRLLHVFLFYPTILWWNCWEESCSSFWVCSNWKGKKYGKLEQSVLQEPLGSPGKVANARILLCSGSRSEVSWKWWNH